MDNIRQCSQCGREVLSLYGMLTWLRPDPTAPLGSGRQTQLCRNCMVAYDAAHAKDFPVKDFTNAR